MSLKLENISRKVDGEYWIKDASLELEPGSFNVLLGRTLAGKTSLMRLMAGLDRPSQGRIYFNGQDVTGIPVRERNISMVYQQFINYPNMTVYDNIASPLKLEKLPKAHIDERVMQTARMLHIEDYLKRYPLELSGGQQQRTAMARALVKNADIILFDEPLVNLDYKLREELRQEMRALFAARNTIAVYATTEPNEALALGGNVVLMHEGEIIQSGQTPRVYHNPATVACAELFGEPPINLIAGTVSQHTVSFSDHIHFALNDDLGDLPPGNYVFGIRPNHLTLVPNRDDDLELAVDVELAEISGSETFLHVSNRELTLVLHLPGVHEYTVDARINIYVPTHKLYVFSQDRQLIQAARSGWEIR
ncbi:ABC transporter ATP-binding protein [Photobacterium galatheae]|uniref:ABC transporter ATP-binding protein n=1 Tax=Photobacterium galatheae TaxID=1654360 RepID=A0A066RSV6_9GAMM|nr:ABC transporter ATP-binding protein [Photobacterium galatheae]KDM93545.1 ABC transporter ATP-binding protein [Photobacterium galatheae]MCM0151369.1 ABC transporter ATP-binding protein [Photobacterium galatheae]